MYKRYQIYNIYSRVPKTVDLFFGGPKGLLRIILTKLLDVFINDALDEMSGVMCQRGNGTYAHGTHFAARNIKFWKPEVPPFHDIKALSH